MDIETMTQVTSNERVIYITVNVNVLNDVDTIYCNDDVVSNISKEEKRTLFYQKRIENIKKMLLMSL
jgi:hypothetical protein